MDNDFLSKEQSFMMGDWFDSFEIIQYLQTRNLFGITMLSEGAGDTNEETYPLTNLCGSVSLIHNSHLDVTQIRLSQGVPVSVAKDLSLIGRVSRERRRLKEYGVAGRA